MQEVHPVNWKIVQRRSRKQKKSLTEKGGQVGGK